MMVKYYGIANCSVVSSVINSVTGESKFCIYAPSGTPVKLLQQHKFINDMENGCFYKFLSNKEIAELYQKMSPDKQWSVIGKGRFVDEKGRQSARKLCWVSTVMLFLPFILVFTGVAIIVTTTNGPMEESNVVTAIRLIANASVSVSPLVGIISLVIARFKDPKSTFANILTFVYKYIAVITIVLVIVTAIIYSYHMWKCNGSLLK